jgi:hypothetical protein
MWRLAGVVVWITPFTEFVSLRVAAILITRFAGPAMT